MLSEALHALHVSRVSYAQHWTAAHACCMMKGCWWQPMRPVAACEKGTHTHTHVTLTGVIMPLQPETSLVGQGFWHPCPCDFIK